MGIFTREKRPSLVVEFQEPRHQQRPSLIEKEVAQRMANIPEAPAKSPVGEDKKQVPSADKPAATPPAASSAVPSFTASKIPSHAPDPVSTSSSAAAASKTKYKLLSVYALLPPALRREHWAAEQFNVEKRLHHGYASQVFQARDKQSGQLMAVKVYDLRQLGELNKVQLVREIQLHGAFVHRNIVELYAAFQEGYRVALVQRFAEGGDLLRALHRSGGKLSERTAVQMVIQPLCQALMYLHSKGITHRDIKPENILYDGNGVLKLADFGLAIDLTQESAVTRAGTLHYMAPEVVRCPLKAHPDDNKADTRFHYNAVVDTWAVGCLAYELVAGAPPFMAETQQDVVRNINTKEVRYPSKMSEECRTFVTWCLQRNPTDRPGVKELLEHKWITLHQRRSSSRNLQLNPAGSAQAGPSDFMTGIAAAKAAMAKLNVASSTSAKELSHMAPF